MDALEDYILPDIKEEDDMMPVNSMKSQEERVRIEANICK